jgi:circadian clock protein KaiC
MKNVGVPPRIDTGVSGLDDILAGGLPVGQVYLLEGDPGTGKTTVGMQFIMAGTRKNDKSLYVTLSESKVELAGSASSHGWNPKDIPIAEFIT